MDVIPPRSTVLLSAGLEDSSDYEQFRHLTALLEYIISLTYRYIGERGTLNLPPITLYRRSIIRCLRRAIPRVGARRLWNLSDALCYGGWRPLNLGTAWVGGSRRLVVTHLNGPALLTNYIGSVLTSESAHWPTVDLRRARRFRLSASILRAYPPTGMT